MPKLATLDDLIKKQVVTQLTEERATSTDGKENIESGGLGLPSLRALTPTSQLPSYLDGLDSKSPEVKAFKQASAMREMFIGDQNHGQVIGDKAYIVVVRQLHVSNVMTYDISLNEDEDKKKFKCTSAEAYDPNAWRSFQEITTPGGTTFKGRLGVLNGQQAMQKLQNEYRAVLLVAVEKEGGLEWQPAVGYFSSYREQAFKQLLNKAKLQDGALYDVIYSIEAEELEQTNNLKPYTYKFETIGYVQPEISEKAKKLSEDIREQLQAMVQGAITPPTLGQAPVAALPTQPSIAQAVETAPKVEAQSGQQLYAIPAED